MQENYQTVKEWLSRARGMKRRLTALQESKTRAYAIACSYTAAPRLNAAAQSPSAQPDAKAALYAFLSDEVDKQTAQLEQTYAEIMQVITQLKDYTLAILLTEYYINGNTWDTVAQEMWYSKAHILKALHPKALREVGKILKANGKI